MADTGSAVNESLGRQPDAETRKLLALMEANEQPPIWTLKAPAARRIYDPMTAASAHPPEVVGRVEDLETSDGISLRIYRPETGESSLPALLFFHGGGGVLGNLDTHDAMCRTLANAAAAVVIAVAYRLGPEHRFPAAFEDAWTAWQQLLRDAATFGVDAGRIAVGGDSAGAGLAAAVTQRAAAQGGRIPAFQLLLCPSLDATRDADRYPSFAENSDGYFMTRDLMDWFLANYLSDDADRSDPRLSPLLGKSHDTPPPTLIATAGFDPLRDEGKAYADALSAAGANVTYRCYDQAIHDFFSFGRFLPFAVPALRECAAVMGETLARIDTGNQRHE